MYCDKCNQWETRCTCSDLVQRLEARSAERALLAAKRLITPYPHRPWRMPRRLLALSVVAFGFLAWLLGVLEHKWPPIVDPGPITTQPGTDA